MSGGISLSRDDNKLMDQFDKETTERTKKTADTSGKEGLSAGRGGGFPGTAKKVASLHHRKTVSGAGAAGDGSKGSDGDELIEKKEHKKKSSDNGKAHVQKRTKRASRKELLDLIHRKNELLQEMEYTLEEAREQIEIKEDRMLRIAAEFENYKKRTRREWDLLQQKANAGLIGDILNVLDDFDRALEAAEDEEGHFHSGVKLIYMGLLDVLKRNGLEEIEADKQPFDPQFHEAISEVESEEVKEGHVAHVVRKGYLLNNNLLRPSRVVVAKKKQD